MRGHIAAHGDGAWRLHWEVGTDPLTGRRRKATKVIRGSRRDAERALAAFVAAADRGEHAGTRGRTFGQVVDEYLDHKTLELEETTADTYRHYAGYIPDQLRAQPVTKIGVDDLERLYGALRRAGRKRDGGPMSSSAVKSVHLVCRGALDYARRRRWVAANVAEDAQVPAGRAHKPSPAPADAVARLLAEAGREHPALPTYLRVSIAAGGRRSEIHGLRWAGVDFDRGRLLVHDVVVRADGRWIVKPRTKTGDARVIALDLGTIETLRQLHVRAMDLALYCGTTLHRDAFVFSDAPDGSESWNPRTTAQRFSRVCRRIGIDPGTRLHDLRHLMATHLIDSGVPLPAVSGRLGHADNAITLSIYAGRIPRSDEVAAEVMGKLLGGADISTSD